MANLISDNLPCLHGFVLNRLGEISSAAVRVGLVGILWQMGVLGCWGGKRNSSLMGKEES